MVAGAAPSVADPAGDGAGSFGDVVPDLRLSVVFHPGFDEYLAVVVVVIAFEVVDVAWPDA